MKDFTPLQAYTVDGLRRLSFALLSVFSFALIIKHINREAVLILGIPRHDATADEELRLLLVHQDRQTTTARHKNDHVMVFVRCMLIDSELLFL